MSPQLQRYVHQSDNNFVSVCGVSVFGVAAAHRKGPPLSTTIKQSSSDAVVCVAFTIMVQGTKAADVHARLHGRCNLRGRGGAHSEIRIWVDGLSHFPGWRQ